jgi:hypothetical protein
MDKRLIYLAPFLILSGLFYDRFTFILYSLPSWLEFSNLSTFVEGATFGIVIAIWLYKYQDTSFKNALILTAFSCGAYFIAYLIAISLTTFFIIGFPAAGFVGATILAFAIKGYVIRINTKDIVTIGIVGAAAALPFIVLVKYVAMGDSTNFFASHLSFVIWQVVVGLTIGWTVLKNKTSLSARPA